jgi:hypothetical protein
MRYADMRAWTEESGALLDKKRLGRKQKARLADLLTLLSPEETHHVPPATPTRPVTGVDEQGFASADRDGAHWYQRVNVARTSMTLRVQRRATRFGRYGTQPMRSRIQRQSRKTRTGGVK